MQRTLYVDLRLLQEPNYRVRGIGHHVAALLRARSCSDFSRWRTVGLIDARSQNLPSECSALVDEISASLNPCLYDRTAVFIDGTPMTHDTRFSLRFLANPACFTAAVVYDFIPLDWPGYLPTVESRIYYLAKLARLRAFDLFLPISEYTAWRISDLLGVCRSRVHVTGASVRRSLYALGKRLTESASAYDGSNPYFMIVLASDPRKNPDVVVKAVRHLNLLYGRRIPLKIVGHYDDIYKNRLLSLAGHADGPGFLEFHQGVSDEELALLYAGATATVAPSHIEGFSLPIVEAAVCGCPVVASTCAAHLELVEDPEALFQSDDVDVLSEKLEAILNSFSLRQHLVASQAHLAGRFHENAVGQRFWNAIGSTLEKRAAKIPAASRKRKPALAFLSPFPPDQAGPAFYTANIIQAGKNLFHSDLYTDAPRPLTVEGPFRDLGSVSVVPVMSGRYDGVISVIGNSLFHSGIFDVFERYGGPCILHDARLIQIYVRRFGYGEFLKLASRLLGRSISMDEVNAWMQDRNPASLLLEPIVERADPLIVHTVTQQAEIKKRYGVNAHVNACCSNITFEDGELTAFAKQATRERLGVSPGSFLVSSFGIVDRVKGTESCLLAVDLLRSWNIPVELYLVGGAGVWKAEVDRIAGNFGIAPYVHCQAEFVDDATYRDFLVASDAGVQLRTFGFGQFSGGLSDCINAGLPAVANSDLAASCDAPAFVARVPDRFSPLQVAEQLAVIWENYAGREPQMEERAAYLKTHNFEYYGQRLLEILGIV